MPKRSSKSSRKNRAKLSAWPWIILVTALVALALSSYLAEAFGDSERSLGPKLFYYQTAALVRPFSPRLRAKVGTIYDQTGRFTEADRELRGFLEGKANKLQLAQVRIHERHFPEAGESLSGLDQKSPNIELYRSWVLFGEGNISAARASYAKLANGGVKPEFETDSNLLGVLLALPDAAKANRLLRPSDPLTAKLKPWVDSIGSYASPASQALETVELYRSVSLPRPALSLLNTVISTNAEYVPAIQERFEINQELGQTQAAARDRENLEILNPMHI